MTRLVHGIVSLDPPTIRCDGCGHEATGQTLAMVVQHSGIEFDPARYLADPRRLCRGCRIKAGWRVAVTRTTYHHNTTRT